MPHPRFQKTGESRRGFKLIRLALVAGPLLLLAGGAHAQQVSQPFVHAPVTPLSSEALITRSLAPIEARQPGGAVRQRGDLELTGPLPPVTGPVALDPLVQRQVGPAPSAAPPMVVRTIEAIPQQSGGIVPPDVTAAVGFNHYIEMVNNALAIYSKTGATLLGPIAIHSLWAGIGTPCGTQDAGDPIVRYDRLADRWLISQFELNERVQCIAVSKGPNPVTDGWYLYAFPTQTATGTKISADYPKIGVWPDGYYMGTQRGFPNSGLDVWVFEREKMLQGAPARQIQFNVGAPSLFLLPSDFDGGRPPPAGAPNVFARHVDGDLWGGQDRLELFEFRTNWANPSASTFQLTALLRTAPFSAVLCGDQFLGACADQPGTPQKLETLPAWMMWRLQYRNFETHETLVTNHTVNAGENQAAIRWYELRKQAGGAWSIFQQGTHSPDTAHRWMGSIAMDEGGNIALGFTVSSANIFPSLRVATRNASDPLGVLPSEITILAGNGSQTTPFRRWGDYTSMEVDPSAPCTFWYSGEYYKTTSLADWLTAAVGFRMPSCPGAEVAFQSRTATAGIGQPAANAPDAIKTNPQAAAIARGVSSGRIVGGDPVQIANHPWQVALVRGFVAEPTRSQFCGGSLIANNWILTAAHCVRNSVVREDPARISVVAGTSQFFFGGERIEVAAIHVHPQNNSTTQDFDYALLRLSRPVTTGGTAVTRPVDLANAGTQVAEGTKAFVTGWGATAEGGPGSMELLGVEVPVISNAACNQPESYNGDISAAMMCAGRETGGIDSCQGDSGGPLTALIQGRTILIGVVSWDEGCARRLKYGIYARVSAAADWIASTIGSKQTTVPLSRP